MKLTDKQRCAVMQKCIERAVKNGFNIGDYKLPNTVSVNIDILGKYCVFGYSDKHITQENWELEIFRTLYDTSNGFAKALWGDMVHASLCLHLHELGFMYHLRKMVGTDPIVYLFNWLKEKQK